MIEIPNIDTFEDYVEWTTSMSVYLEQVPARGHEATEYEIAAFIGEIGEFYNIHKKWLTGKITDPIEYRMKMMDELGDIMFYLARILARHNFEMDDVISNNVNKLIARYKYIEDK